MRTQLALVAIVCAACPGPPTELCAADGDCLKGERCGGDGRCTTEPLEPLGPLACVTAGGCVIEGACALPCPGVEAPEAPNAPGRFFTPCSPGWTLLDGGGCAPFGAGPAPRCAEGEAPFASVGCAPIGSECPDPPGFPTGLGAAVFVSSHAAPGGDGSRERPYATLTEALTGRTPLVVLDVGEHVFEGRIDGARIQGACARETRLSSPGGLELLSDASLRDLTIEGPILARGDNRLDTVAVRSSSVAVTVEGTLELWVSMVRGERGGVLVRGAAASLNAVRVTIDGGAADAVLAVRARQVRLLDASLQGRSGVVTHATPLEATDAFGEGHGNALFQAFAAPITLRGVGARAARTGVLLDPGSRADVDIATFRETREEALFVGDSVTATVSFLVDRDNALGPDDPVRASVVMFQGRARLEHVRVLDSVRPAFELYEASASMMDVAIRGLRRADDEIAMRVLHGAELTAERLELIDCDARAIVLRDGSRATITDLSLANVGRNACECTGLCAQEGSRITLRRARIEGARGLAVQILTDASLDAESLAIEDVPPGVCPDGHATAFNGIGLLSLDGGKIAATRFELSRAASQGAALIARHHADIASLELSEGFVHDNPIGILLGIDGYDPGRVLEGVRFERNTTNLRAD